MGKKQHCDLPNFQQHSCYSFSILHTDLGQMTKRQGQVLIHALKQDGWKRKGRMRMSRTRRESGGQRRANWWVRHRQMNRGSKSCTGRAKPGPPSPLPIQAAFSHPGNAGLRHAQRWLGQTNALAAIVPPSSCVPQLLLPSAVPHGLGCPLGQLGWAVPPPSSLCPQPARWQGGVRHRDLGAGRARLSESHDMGGLAPPAWSQIQTPAPYQLL